MAKVTIPFAAVVAVNVAVVAIAFVAAPRSCEGGLTLYFWSGMASLIVLGALPFLTSLGHSVAMRLAWGLGFVVLGVAVWFAGLFAANVRIMCRLF